MHDDPELPACTADRRVASVTLRNPARRNALDARALCALEAAIEQAARCCESRDTDCVVLRGEGASFCAGFDLAACAEEPTRVGEFLSRLSSCVRLLREIDAPVVARVQGAALAGGCALLTGCDFVVVADDAQLGYPTHRIGISPAVSLPSLFSRMGGAARALAISNELIDGRAALARGLATAAVPINDLDTEVDALVTRLLSKGPEALRATKRWLRTLEEVGCGELGPARGRDRNALADACDASMALGAQEEFATMLRAFWASRGGR